MGAVLATLCVFAMFDTLSTIERSVLYSHVIIASMVLS
jgi:hypothetical protein